MVLAVVGACAVDDVAANAICLFFAVVDDVVKVVR